MITLISSKNVGGDRNMNNTVFPSLNSSELNLKVGLIIFDKEWLHLRRCFQFSPSLKKHQIAFLHHSCRSKNGEFNIHTVIKLHELKVL